MTLFSYVRYFAILCLSISLQRLKFVMYYVSLYKCFVYKCFVRMLNLQGIQFRSIYKNKFLVNNTESTVIIIEEMISPNCENSCYKVNCKADHITSPKCD